MDAAQLIQWLGNGTAWAVCGRPLVDIRGAARFAILGTILGPHVIRDGERSARR